MVDLAIKIQITRERFISLKMRVHLSNQVYVPNISSIWFV